MNKSLIFFACVLPLWAFSQNNTITGVVQDSSGAPISFATVMAYTPNAQNIQAGTITDESGAFTLEDLTSGLYEIKIEMLGYGSVVKTIDSDGTTSNDLGLVVLDLQEENLGEVTLEFRRPKIKRSAGRLVFDIEKTTLSSGTGYGAIAKTPGVVMVNNQITIKNRPTTIFINGRRLYLSAQETQVFLQNLDAALIKSIEVITNPGAEMDAESSTALNINTTKTLNPGYKGSATSRYRQGVFAKYQLSTTHFYKNQWLQMYASYSVSPEKNNKDQSSYIRFVGPGTPETLSVWRSDFNRVTDQITHQGFVQGEITVNQKNTITVSAQLSLTPDKTYTNRQNTTIYNQLFRVDSSFVTQSNTAHNTLEHVTAIDWTHKFNKATQWATGGQYINFANNQDQWLKSNYFDPYGAALQEVAFTTDSEQTTEIITAHSDFTHELGDASLKLGAKYSDIKTNTQWGIDNNQPTGNTSAVFDYQETIYAGYGLYESSWDQWTLNTGMRYEQTQVNSLSTDTQSNQDRAYGNWFPNLSLSKQTSEKHNFGLTYAKKIQRPRYQSLNPFRYYLNENNFNQGNPNLVPAIEDKITLSYTYNNEWFFEAYYQQIDQALEVISFQDNTNFFLRQTDVNIEDYRQFSMDMSYAKELTASWFTSLITSAYYISNEFIAEESDDALVTNATPGVFLQSYNQWVWGGKQQHLLELTTSYISNLVSGSLDYNNLFEFSTSYQRTLIPKIATVTIGVDDLFNTKNVAVSSRYLNQDNRYMPRPESRMVWISLKYGFGSHPSNKRKSLQNTQERDRLN
tara:strand:+ start:16174 stop:18570 length:2397 start_codon:yes stop_codon:yes gene_type:complete